MGTVNRTRPYPAASMTRSRIKTCAIFTRPALGTVTAFNDIRRARRLVLVNRHSLDKEALRAAQTVIQRCVNRFVELGDGIRMAILDIAPFDDLRATPDSRPPHVIAHQLNHIGMPHALARRKVAVSAST